MEIQNILIFLLVFHFASTDVVTTTKTENYVSLLPLKYGIKFEFFLQIPPTTSTILYSTPVGVFTITAKAPTASNKFKFRKISHTFYSLKVNVTNLTEKKTIPVSNATRCAEDQFLICVSLEDSFQAGDNLEIVTSDEFSKMRLYTYDDYDDSTNKKHRKFYGVYNLADFVPSIIYREKWRALLHPRVTMQFTIGLGGVWKNSHKIIGISNSLGKPINSLSNNTRWTHFQESPPLDFENVQLFISEFVNYTLSTESNQKVSVWGPPNFIFENGTAQGSPTEFANYTVSFASSLLNKYEKILDIKYPLDGFEIIFLNSSWESFPPNHRVLGQIYLERNLNPFCSNSAMCPMQILSRLINGQFIGVMVDEPLDFGLAMAFSGYVESLCIETKTGTDIYRQTIMNMLEGFLSPEIVLNGIRIYTKSHIWKRATNNDLFEAMEESISRQNSTDLFLPEGVKVKNVIGNYAYLKWYSLQVNASLLSRESNHIQLHFEKFVTLRFEHWLPVQVKLGLSLENSTEILQETFRKSPNTSVLTVTKVGGHALTNSSEIQWLLVDKNWNGDHFVFYDPVLLSRLVVQLNKNCSVFSPRERYNILQNGGIDVSYSKFPLENFFLLTSYFGKETESNFWSSAMRKLPKYKFLCMGSDEVYEESRKHFVPKIESYIESRGGLKNMINSIEEPIVSSWFQEACLLLRAPSCLRFASENLKKSVFKTKWVKAVWFQAAGADPQNFEYLKQRFFNVSDNGKSRQKYFRALEWTSNDTLYETFLNSVLEKNSKALRFHRYGSSMEIMALSQSRIALLVNFAKTKFEQRKISSFLFTNVVYYVLKFYGYSGVVSDIKLYKNLKIFIDVNQGKLKTKHYDHLQHFIMMCDEMVYNPDSYWNRNGKNFLLWLKKFNEEGYTMA